MLLAVQPLALVAATIGPSEDTLSLFLVGDILALIATTVHPAEEAMAMHPVLLPLALEFAAITPTVNSNTMDVIVQELSLEAGAIRPRECAFASFATMNITANVLRTIWPGLCAFSVLLVF
eukprot:CAMPEP_0197630962 /NCGR_PEP_ID=MMETSP1338-20131121/8287_1 /TAXON_ID=43686 ORGANISM="Pelagodinium beii, Strain RCC1491" /NCGR_SAMPLE_ID=MMETSP1338 /ASSEMBLY_ACC=CAM_ASM_000754 /LENGTH=120 /DNA_ID=CAMNT_0043202317 /DNA_START=80 /DNA_END=442 /DNA_ORIENTATION=-